MQRTDMDASWRDSGTRLFNLAGADALKSFAFYIFQSFTEDAVLVKNRLVMKRNRR